MFLWLGLVLALWINYETWQRDYAIPVPAVTAPAPATSGAGSLAASVPRAPTAAAPVVAALAPVE